MCSSGRATGRVRQAGVGGGAGGERVEGIDGITAHSLGVWR